MAQCITIQNTYYTYLYDLYVFYTIHEMARFGMQLQGAIQYILLLIYIYIENSFPRAVN